MYASKNDGLNHQANVTIQLDMETMRITDSFTSVSNSNYGYVSHSFNQFIQVENNRIVALDHGDAYPRSLVLSKYQADISTGSFASNGVQTVPVVTFPGAIGQNATGAAAGGLALSDSSYLVAGHSVIQDESNLTRSTRNVFVAAVDKETSAVTMNWLTSYAEGDGTTSTPQMVQISNSEFLILWSRDGQAYYTKVDGRGKRIAEIYSMEGSLSDCVPIIMNQKAIWYIWEDGTLIFYEIPLNALDQADSTVIENGHHCENHQYISSVTKQPTIYEPGIRTYTCSICGAQYTEEIPRLSAPEETPSGQTNAGKSSQGGAKRVKKNRKKTIGGVTYKVTKAGISKRAEVMVIGISGKRKKAVTIPATVRVDGVSCKVTGIGKRVFRGCGKLKKITIKTKTLRTVGKQAFKGIQKKAVIKVPKSKYKAYKKLFRANTGFRKTMKIKKLKS